MSTVQTKFRIDSIVLTIIDYHFVTGSENWDLKNEKLFLIAYFANDFTHSCSNSSVKISKKISEAL